MKNDRIEKYQAQGDIMTLYLDESGTRHPDRNPNDKLPAHGRDWFGIGGVIVRNRDSEQIKNLHRSFCNQWDIRAPLHSIDIRMKRKAFHWLNKISEDELQRFYDDLELTCPQLPVHGL